MQRGKSSILDSAIFTMVLKEHGLPTSLKTNRKVKKLIESVEKKGQQIIMLNEVLIETVWILESVYECTREEIYRFLETLMRTSIFVFSEPQVMRNAIYQFKKIGDFADLVIVMQTLYHHAKKIFSFDKKLQKSFPVTRTLTFILK